MAERQDNDEAIEAISKYGGMTLVQLKDELKQRNLKMTGNKAELLQRLKKYDRSNDDDDAEGNDRDDESNDDESSDDEDGDDEYQMTEHINEPARHRRKHVLTFKDVEDTIDKFSGDDGRNVVIWIKEFDDLATLCNWTKEHKTIYAKRLLAGSARIFVNHEARGKSWKDISDALRAEFAPRVDSHAVHQKLQRRKKKPEETYHGYCYQMLDIASPITLETSALIQYIIDGIIDDEVNKTILYGANSIAELKIKLNMYELMKSKMKNTSNVKNRFDDHKKKSNVNGEKSEIKRCFNCGAKSHLSMSCPLKQKGVRCFNCNEHGHISIKCPKRTEEKQNKACNAIRDATENGVKVKSEKTSKNLKVVKIGEDEVSALIDTGSDISLMRADFYVKIGAPNLIKRPIKFRGIGASENVTLGRACIKVGIDDNYFEIMFHVVPDSFLSNAILIGTDFLRGVELRIKNSKVNIFKTTEEDDESVFVGKIDIASEATEMDLSHISNQNHKMRLRNMISEYKPQKTKDVDIKLKIVVKDEIPVYQRARRLAPQESQIVDSQIQMWLDQNIIQPSYSDYASPIVLVKKKNGSSRLCVDFRKLNEKIVKVRYPLPIMEDQINKMQGARVFSTLDLTNGFFHVAVAEDSRKYTAFIVPNGHYEFLRMPFGLCTSPAYFQKYINAVFHSLVVKGIVSIYMDDLIIPSADCQEGLSRLEEVFSVASEHGLIINFRKCQFLQTKVCYLGYIIENGTVTINDEKTKAVKEFPKPKDIKSVQSFLGLTGYFRKFVAGYATIARPLTELLKGNVQFHFDKNEIEAFNRLKESLCNRPVLRIYSPKADTELHTDASSQGFGAILMQRDSEDRHFHPVYFMSVKTSTTEAKLHSYELEALAIIKAIRKFRIYLIGISFKIVTDCQAFKLTLKKADCCPKIARWVLFLQDFTYTIEHRPGKNMQHVDALSRNSLPETMIVCESHETTTAKLLEAQLNDDRTKELRKRVESGKEKVFCIRNELLHKIVSDEALIVVPEAMQDSIIRHVHNRGHFAAEKTEKLLKMDYWFEAMRPKIDKNIQNCIDCILAEKKVGKLEGWLHPIDKEGVPFGTYHIDHLGPLPSTRKKSTYIFAVIDGFTKFVWLYPVKTTNATEVINKLVELSAIFGNPRRIISDRGAAFTSHDFENYCKDEMIKHEMIATGVPRGNGQIERINRILIPLLTKLTAPNPAEWYKYVDKAQRYLNNIPSRSTGMSPFHLLVGTRMRMKEDPLIKEILEEESAIMYQLERDKSRKLAKESIAKIQEENKRAYNRKRKSPPQYQEGDIVAIKRTQGGPGLKFATKYLGPYRIKRVLRNERYVVEKVGEGEGPLKTSTAVDYMKPWGRGVIGRERI